MPNPTAHFATSLGEFTVELYLDKAPITAGNFTSATQVVGEPSPHAAGTPESLEVNLAPGTYYFALRTEDEVNNESGV